MKTLVFWLSGVLVVLGLSCTSSLMFTAVTLACGGYGLWKVCSTSSWDDLKKITGASFVEKKTGIDFMTEED